jgi:hypothetical protein
MDRSQDLYNEEQTSRFLKVSIKTLQAWRQRKIGPRYFKLGSRVRYSVDDLTKYLSSCAVEPEHSIEAAVYLSRQK